MLLAWAPGIDPPAEPPTADVLRPGWALLLADPEADPLDETPADSPPADSPPAADALCPGWVLLLAWGPAIDSPADPPNADVLCPGWVSLLALDPEADPLANPSAAAAAKLCLGGGNELGSKTALLPAGGIHAGTPSADALPPGWGLLLAWGPGVDPPAAPPDADALCPGLALLLACAAANF